MPIIDDPNDKEYPVWADEPLKMVQCGTCGRTARPAESVHGAASNANAEGFRSVRGETKFGPRDWACPECLATE